MTLKNRHIIGAGAAACAACCAVPLLSIPVLAGLGATVAAFICSGSFLAVTVAAVAGLVVRQHRQHRQQRREQASACAPAGHGEGSVDLEFTTTPLRPRE